VNEALAVAISHLSFLRGQEKLRLYRAVDSVEKLSRLSRDDIGDLVGRRLLTRSWEPTRMRLIAERDLDFLTRRRVSLVGFGESGYPPWLTEIYDPPFLLYILGAPLPVDRAMLAVVGTRAPTFAGKDAARQLGRGAAAARVPLVSGLARGIDTEAHRGAVEAGGKTIAVLGCGIDTIYPAQNRMLAEQILTRAGSIISEYPPGVPPRQFNFPERNRIISGLSRGAVVVEAPERSGALITADYALEQGRDLFVHAVAEGSPRGAGARALATDGAGVIHGFGDISGEWGLAEQSRTGAPSGREGAAGSGEAEAARDLRAGARDGAGAVGAESVGVQLALDLEAELSGGNHG
jgi:DNA processing protein